MEEKYWIKFSQTYDKNQEYVIANGGYNGQKN
jgi:hypothetical protein